MSGASRPPRHGVARALSKLGLCSRAEGVRRVRAGRVRVNGRRVDDPEHPVRIDGLSPDRQHREIGVGLPWSREDVVDLGRRWDQSAIYWFDGTHMWVIGALTAAPPWRLEPQ